MVKLHSKNLPGNIEEEFLAYLHKWKKDNSARLTIGQDMAVDMLTQDLMKAILKKIRRPEECVHDFSVDSPTSCCKWCGQLQIT